MLELLIGSVAIVIACFISGVRFWYSLLMILFFGAVWWMIGDE
jgi:hypothetical protein